MPHQEDNAYILGTEREELLRLGLQHQVWAEEARAGWRAAGFGAGHRLLDLGCGPGFCSQDLAYIAGAEGRVIGIDKSAAYIEFARSVAAQHGLQIDYRVAGFEDLELPRRSLDGVFSRWALAWVREVEPILDRLVEALRPGGALVFHEYHDWKTFQTEPRRPDLAEGIAAALASFHAAEGDIDIGRRLPALLIHRGLDVTLRPMAKIAHPGSLTWKWPASFLQLYLPKLAAAGALSAEQVDRALADWRELESLPGSTCLAPLMVEVIGRKPR